MAEGKLKTLLENLAPQRTLGQFLRYVVVGGVAFAVDFSFLALLTEVGKINYLISAAISFLLGLVCNYVLSIKWVFSERKFKNKLLEFALFSGIGIVGVVLNEVFIWLLTEKVGIYYLYSKIVTAMIVLNWNFLARKFGLFSMAAQERAQG
jgi:putative flippase GtrA